MISLKDVNNIIDDVNNSSNGSVEPLEAGFNKEDIEICIQDCKAAVSDKESEYGFGLKSKKSDSFKRLTLTKKKINKISLLSFKGDKK